MDLVMQHSAYSLASSLHFCIATCFMRNIKAARCKLLLLKSALVAIASLNLHHMVLAQASCMECKLEADRSVTFLDLGRH